MRHLKGYESYITESLKTDPFVITNETADKFVTFKFDPAAKSNNPGWTDSVDMAYTWDTQKEVDEVEDKLIDDGFFDDTRQYVKKLSEIKK